MNKPTEEKSDFDPNLNNEEEINNGNMEEIIDHDDLDNELAALADFRYSDPFIFIYKLCVNLNSDLSDQLSPFRPIISIRETLESNSIFWQNAIKNTDKKRTIKNALFKFLNYPDEPIYINAAISYFIIGKYEFQNNEWPSFFSDIFKIIFGVIDRSQDELGNKSLSQLQVETQILSALYIIQMSIENNILTPNYSYFDQCISWICEIFNTFLSSYNLPSFQDANEAYNISFNFNEKVDFLFKIQQRCFSLLKSSLPYLSKQIKKPAQCIQMVQLILNRVNEFNDSMTKLQSMTEYGDRDLDILNSNLNELQTISESQKKRILELSEEISNLSPQTINYEALKEVLANEINKLRFEFENNERNINEIKNKMFELSPIVESFHAKIDELAGVIPQFVSDVYDFFGLLYQFYYSVASSCMQQIFNFSMRDLIGDVDILKISAINFWINISNIESYMLKNKQNSDTELSYFIFGVYKFIIPELIKIFEHVRLDEYTEEDDGIEEAAFNCLSSFVRTEPHKVLPYISDIFRINFQKNKSDASYYSALKILLSIIDICQYKLISDFLIQILSCADIQSKSEKLALTSLKVIAQIIAHFPNNLSLRDINTIISTCQNMPKYSETYQIISNLIELFNISMKSLNGSEGIVDFRLEFDFAQDLFRQTKQLVLDSVREDISLSYPAIISLIRNSQKQDQPFLISFFRDLVNLFQDFNNENQYVQNGFIINSDLCQILNDCITTLKNQELNKNSEAQLHIVIRQLTGSIIQYFGNGYDEDLLVLISSLISESTELKFINELIPIVKDLFLTQMNSQRIIIASEFISDLVTSNLNFIDFAFLNEYELFDIYKDILRNQMALRSTHAPIISSLADIINSLKQDSAHIRDDFIDILNIFVNIPLDLSNINDIEYANDLFIALCRAYTAITNFIDDSPEENNIVPNTVLKLFKRIHQLRIHKNNQIILQFVVCIIDNLYQLGTNKYKNRIAFLANNKSVREMLEEAIKIPNQSVKREEKAKRLVYLLYSNQKV